MSPFRVELGPRRLVWLHRVGGTFWRLTADDSDVADKKKIIFTLQEHEGDFICVICVICGWVLRT